MRDIIQYETVSESKTTVHDYSMALSMHCIFMRELHIRITTEVVTFLQRQSWMKQPESLLVFQQGLFLQHHQANWETSSCSSHTCTSQQPHLMSYTAILPCDTYSTQAVLILTYCSWRWQANISKRGICSQPLSAMWGIIFRKSRLEQYSRRSYVSRSHRIQL